MQVRPRQCWITTPTTPSKASGSIANQLLQTLAAEVVVEVLEREAKAREWTWAGAAAREVAVDMELMAEDTVAEAMEEDMVVEAGATEATEADAEDTA